MSIETIGKQIANLRKERGIKQEELANYVGVSTQAVSKWENGGVPDTELLPQIADFFSISIDYLFDRSMTEYGGIQSALMKQIAETPENERIKLAFNYCWDIERALSGIIPEVGIIPEDGSIEEYEKKLAPNEQRHSTMRLDNGFTLMGIANIQQYFLLVPDPKNIEAAYFNDIDYVEFFKDFSDEDVFNTCVMLHQRESKSFFTADFIAKKMSFDIERATEVIKILNKYSFIYEQEIEMNDNSQLVYYFSPTPEFIALLIFTKEIINRPQSYIWNSHSRIKPYL